MAQSSRPRPGSFVVDYGLTRDDFERIADHSHGARAVPLREIRKELRYQCQVVDGRLIGCTPDYFEMNHLVMNRGRFLTDRDLDRVDNVCVIADGTSPSSSFPTKTRSASRSRSKNIFTSIVGQTAEPHAVGVDRRQP